VDFSFDAYWETDAQHRFTRQQFARGMAVLGTEIGKTRWEVPYLEPDEEAWRAHRATLDAHLPFRDFELARPLAGGGQQYVSVSGLPVFDAAGQFVGYRGVGRDITERKRVEQRLLAEHNVTRILAQAPSVEAAAPEVLQTVCESMGWHVGTLWRIDRAGGVLRCAELWRSPSVQAAQFEAATRASVFPPGIGLPGRVWVARAPACIPDAAQDPTFLRASVAQREGLHGAFAFPILLGSEVLGVIDFIGREVLQPDDQLREMMATIGSQIGQFLERKRAEDALQRAQAELTHVTRVMTMGELTASIAHEVNQPLGAIVASAGSCARWLSAQPPQMEMAQRALERIASDGQRAAEVIGRIRRVMKRQAPRMVMLDVNEVILETIALAQYALRRNDIELELQLAEGLPGVRGDRIQLQQVILNLVVNAIDAMSGMSDRHRTLTVVSGYADEKAVRIEVRDSGPGLDPHTADRLFEAFHTTKADGLGMGLAISRSIVEAHGGRLWAMANEPHGAVFQFTLPWTKE
jgi:signal transduction histidine kinase